MRARTLAIALCAFLAAIGADLSRSQAAEWHVYFETSHSLVTVSKNIFIDDFTRQVQFSYSTDKILPCYFAKGLGFVKVFCAFLSDNNIAFSERCFDKRCERVFGYFGEFKIMPFIKNKCGSSPVIREFEDGDKVTPWHQWHNLARNRKSGELFSSGSEGHSHWFKQKIWPTSARSLRGGGLI